MASIPAVHSSRSSSSRSAARGAASHHRPLRAASRDDNDAPVTLADVYARGDRSLPPLPYWVRRHASQMIRHTHPETGAPVYLMPSGDLVHRTDLPTGGVSLGVRAIDDTQLRFIAFGDAGTGTADQQAVADGMRAFTSANEHDCHAALHLGDGFYPSGLQNREDPAFQELFCDFYDTLDKPIFFTLGNHDHGSGRAAGSPEAILALAQAGASTTMEFPARYYSFGFQLRDNTRVDFFALDTSVFASDSAQRAWLDRAIAASNAHCKIVFGHHPVYSNGSHGDQEHLLALVLPLLEGRVDLYLSGHDHDQQVLRSPGGLPLVLSGTAGESRDDVEAGGSRLLFGSGALGFAGVDVDRQGLTISIRDTQGHALFTRAFTPRRANDAQGNASLSSTAPSRPRLPALVARTASI